MPRTRKSDAVKLKELELVQSVVTNPILLFVAGFTAIEVLQKYGLVGNVAGTFAEAALGPIAIAQAVAPLVPLIPSLIPGLGGAAGALTALVPGG